MDIIYRDGVQTVLEVITNYLDVIINSAYHITFCVFHPYNIVMKINLSICVSKVLTEDKKIFNDIENSILFAIDYIFIRSSWTTQKYLNIFYCIF